MSAKPQQNLFIKLVTIVLIFLYLQLLLWSTLLHPAIDIYVHWVPKSFFSSAKQSTCIIRMHHHTPMALFESTFFSTLALFSYFRGSAGIGGVGCGIYGTTLATFEQSMMGVQQKYYWMCLVPWIITFIQNWFENVGEFLILFSSTTVYEALNVFSSMAILMVFLSVQALLASEVIYIALQGWHAMKNINDENRVWEQKKRFLDGDNLNTLFGLVR
ncbi:hypothetical protein FF38_05938 [Lucilia cuprina]|uniref:Uncharacterized protein n=1 Tax=Lucilia cuprina TaxID=7375 RepID=A0A0L0CQ17_LUCCU|nr:hypothetical protein FF38_05938 [Lucilia cuprina]